jgi:hypothetical protein
MLQPERAAAGARAPADVPALALPVALFINNVRKILSVYTNLIPRR